MYTTSDEVPVHVHGDQQCTGQQCHPNHHPPGVKDADMLAHHPKSSAKSTKALEERALTPGAAPARTPEGRESCSKRVKTMLTPTPPATSTPWARMTTTTLFTKTSARLDPTSSTAIPTMVVGFASVRRVESQEPIPPAALCYQYSIAGKCAPMGSVQEYGIM